MADISSERVRQLTKHVKRYCDKLFCKRDIRENVVRVYRNRVRYMSYNVSGETLHVSVNAPVEIMALTHNWSSEGSPVDWGIEPIMQRLAEIDNWSDDSKYDDFCKERDRQAYWKEQSQKHECRAVAADMRKDFAKATTDINTSTIKKIDRRRLKGA